MNTKREKGKEGETGMDAGCWCGNCGSIHPDEIDAVARIRVLEDEVRDLRAREAKQKMENKRLRARVTRTAQRKR